MAADVRSELWATGEELRVETNQRALIDKVLARYSGEYTLFRELLQNADDAGAGRVEISFRSASAPVASTAALPDLERHLVGGVTVRNDGMVFRDEDWKRLRTIADGNPDETKIGAYAVFSITDEPVITSGERSMLFHFKKDSLFVRAGSNPSTALDRTSDGKPWTTFQLSYREPAALPNAEAFARFLAASFAFTNSLRSLVFALDGVVLCSLDKQLAAPKALAIPRSLFVVSPKSFMKLTGVASTAVQIEAKVVGAVLLTGSSATRKAAALKAAASSAPTFATKMLQSAFGFGGSSSAAAVVTEPTPVAGSIERGQTLEATFFMRVVAGQINVSVPSAFRADLERATKKRPPSTTKFQLLYSSKDEYEATRKADNQARRVFDNLVSTLDIQGRVAIGFMTHQQSGCAASVAAAFIPTVERESLDLQHPAIADYNRELLWCGGVLARIVYEDELAEIGRMWTELGDDASARDWLIARASHVAQFFSFSASTPSPVVSADMDHAYLSAERGGSFTLISDKGPRAAKDVRMPSSEVAAFVKRLPVIPAEAAAQMSALLGKLRERGVLREISLDDIWAELGSRALELDEARAMLSWWIQLASNQSYRPELRTKLLSSTVVAVPAEKTLGQEARPLPLDAVRFILDTRLITPDVPLPPDTLPFALSRTFRPADLVNVFGWRELPVINLLRYLVSPAMTAADSGHAETNLLASPHFAEKILLLLAKSWSSIATSQQTEIADLLRDRPMLPTRRGLRKPSESYMPNVTMFDDLDIVVLPSGAPIRPALERVLAALGVRKHVDIVFNRLLGGGSWSHVEMLRYLVSVKDTLSSQELDKLRKTSFLPKDGEPLLPGLPDVNGNVGPPRTVRYPASQLYEPTEAMRELEMPLLAWTGKWRSTSDEARFLTSLGLLRTPPVQELLAIASRESEPGRRKKALSYFLAHYSANNYATSYTVAAHSLAFVPCIKPDGSSAFGVPLEVFSNPACAVLGFNVLDPAYAVEAPKFKLRVDPPAPDLLKAVVNPAPRDVAKASKIFAYLSTQVSSFGTTHLSVLRDARILPVTRAKAVTLEAPGTCYLASAGSDRGIYGSLLNFVDFGPASVPFLRAVGVKNEPTPAEIAALILADPTRIYAAAGSAEKYLCAQQLNVDETDPSSQILRGIASNAQMLPGSLKRQMRSSPFLLGSRRIAMSAGSTGDAGDDDEIDDEVSTHYSLVAPSSLVIVDDVNAHSSFAATVIACPQEDLLEAFAEELGAVRISRLVTDTFRTAGAVNPTTPRATQTQTLVIERAELFLHERRSQNRKDIAHDASWLKAKLEVADVGKLELHRTLRYADTSKTVVRPASAAASMVNGKLQLALAQNIEVDWYEVADTLCRFLLVRQRVDDALLFMTLLATGLKMLKRRGFNVDRILNARRIERETEEQRERDRQLAAELDKANAPSPERLNEYQQQLGTMFPDADPSHVDKLLRSHKDDHLQRAAAELSDGRYPRKPRPQLPGAMPEASGDGGEDEKRQSSLFSSFKKRFATRPPTGLPSIGPAESSNAIRQPSSAPVARPPPQPRMPDPQSQVSPTNDIKSNVLRAIAASRPDNDAAVKSLPTMREVREPQSSYCDATHATDLVYVLDVAGLRTYFARDVTDAASALEQHGAALRRFATSIIRPLADVFGMNPRSLHLFYDLAGPLIAFNRSGAVYCNLRYYVGWHDRDVQAGNPDDALISWYMSLAHELAHNLVSEHNSEHEFYFSSIAEQSLVKLTTLLAKSRATPAAA